MSWFLFCRECGMSYPLQRKATQVEKGGTPPNSVNAGSCSGQPSGALEHQTEVDARCSECALIKTIPVESPSSKLESQTRHAALV